MPKRQLRRSFKDQGFKGRKIYGDRKRKRIDEVVDMIELTKEFSTLRLVGPLVAYALWWMEIKTPQGKKVSIPKVPLGFDSEKGELIDEVEDPYADMPNVRLQVAYYINAIDRAAQEKEPRRRPKPTKNENESGFKEKSSNTWTPVGVVRIPPMIAQQLQALETKNRWKVRTKGGVQVRTFDLTHPKHGRDVYLSKDKDANSPANMYNLSLADKSPLTEEEMDYFIWDLQGLADKEGPMCPESLEEAKREVKGLIDRDDKEEETEDDLSEDFMEEDEEGLDDDLPWDDMSESDDEDKPTRPRRRRRKKPAAKSEGRPRKRLRKRRRSQSRQSDDAEERPLKSRRKRRKLRSQ